MSQQPDNPRDTTARQQARAHSKLLRSTPSSQMQVRMVADVLTRAAGDPTSDELVVEGYAAVFEEPSEIMSFWGIEWDERIAPGSFTDCLAADPDVRFMGQHEGNALARTTNGTLELVQDEKGLWFRATLNPKVQEARDLHALIERGDITQMSFGFCMDAPHSVSCEKLGHDLCHIEHDLITRVTKLFEISAVTFPAYPQTTVDDAQRTAPAHIERDADVATLAANRDMPSGDESSRDVRLRSQITSWSTRWSTFGSSAPSS